MPIANNQILIVSKSDYESLLPLAEKYETPAAEALDDELGRAEIVRDEEFPEDVVAMNSFVTFLDLDTGETTSLSLVYPGEANVEQMRISILSPVGTALIGLRVKGRIDWPLPNGKVRRLQVNAVKQMEKTTALSST